MGRFRFRVYPPDGEPYETTAKRTFSRFELPALVPDVTVSVLVDPRDSKKVTLA